MALAAAVHPHTGPWLMADGSERSVLVDGVGEVGMECVDSLGRQMSYVLQPTGPTAFPKDVRRYRIVRHDAGEPITVRVHI
jgi:hypothetical protein